MTEIVDITAETVGTEEVVPVTETPKSQETKEPLEPRIKTFFKQFKEGKTTWEDLIQFIDNDGEDFLQQMQIVCRRSRKLPKIKAQIPTMLANYIAVNGRESVKWVGVTWMRLAEDILKQRAKDALNTPVLTIEDAHRLNLWESETRELAAKFLKQDKEFAPGSAAEGANKMLKELLGKYPDNQQEIKDLMIELLSADVVILEWVADQLEPQEDPSWKSVTDEFILNIFDTPFIATGLKNRTKALFDDYPEDAEAIKSYLLETVIHHEDYSQNISECLQNAYDEWCKESISQYAA